MIKLIDKGPDESLIEFSPRPQRKTRTITRQLVYGHACTWCGNVIQALFLTEEPVDLSLYEETRVISQGEKNNGTLLKVVPNSEDLASAYKVNFYPTPNGHAELIRLKNHLVNWKGMTDAPKEKDYYFEPGERCCRYTGLFSRQELSYIAELAKICRYPLSYYTQPVSPVPLSFLKTWKGANTWSQLDFRVVEAVGRSSELLLFNKDLVKADQNQYPFSDLFETWNKSVELNKQLAAAAVPETASTEEYI